MTQPESCHRQVCVIEEAAPSELVHIVTHEHQPNNTLNNIQNPASGKMFLASIW